MIFKGNNYILPYLLYLKCQISYQFPCNPFQEILLFSPCGTCQSLATPHVQERASFHRQQLRQRLGLVAQGKVFSTGMEGLFEDSDLVVTMTTTTEGEGRGRSGGRQEKVWLVSW